ncbi:hypothetical protein Lser_V15G32265 [Lactuca serriola]
MASLVLLLSELLIKHHDAETCYTSSSSSSCSSRPCLSSVAATAAADVAAKRVIGKSWRNGFGGYRREEDLVEEDEAESMVSVEFV